MDEKKAMKLGERLGASRVEKLAKRPSGVPLGLLHLRAQVQGRLQSSGGRPTDPSWTLSRQVPFKAETWDRLQRAAEELGTTGRRVGAAQVAAVLLERQLGTERTTSRSLEDLRSCEPISLSQAAEITGITYRQLDHWCRRGLLPLAGKVGRHRLVEPEELVRAVSMARLARLGEDAKKLAPRVGDLDLSKHYLVVELDGGEDAVRNVDTVQEVHDEMAVIIDLESVREWLLGRLGDDKGQEGGTRTFTNGHSAVV